MEAELPRPADQILYSARRAGRYTGLEDRVTQRYQFRHTLRGMVSYLEATVNTHFSFDQCLLE
jgi:hypothetical protein